NSVSNMIIRANPTTLAVDPDLAEKWEQVDPQNVVFHFRGDAKWHNIAPVNGRAFTSDDAKFTIDRVRTADPRYLHASYYSNVDALQTSDKATLRLTTKTPFAPQ